MSPPGEGYALVDVRTASMIGYDSDEDIESSRRLSAVRDRYLKYKEAKRRATLTGISDEVAEVRTSAIGSSNAEEHHDDISALLGQLNAALELDTNLNRHNLNQHPTQQVDHDHVGTTFGDQRHQGSDQSVLSSSSSRRYRKERGASLALSAHYMSPPESQFSQRPASEYFVAEHDRPHSATYRSRNHSLSQRLPSQTTHPSQPGHRNNYPIRDQDSTSQTRRGYSESIISESDATGSLLQYSGNRSRASTHRGTPTAIDLPNEADLTHSVSKEQSSHINYSSNAHTQPQVHHVSQQERESAPIMNTKRAEIPHIESKKTKAKDPWFKSTFGPPLKMNLQRRKSVGVVMSTNKENDMSRKAEFRKQITISSLSSENASVTSSKISMSLTQGSLDTLSMRDLPPTPRRSPPLPVNSPQELVQRLKIPPPPSSSPLPATTRSKVSPTSVRTAEGLVMLESGATMMASGLRRSRSMTGRTGQGSSTLFNVYDEMNVNSGSKSGGDSALAKFRARRAAERLAAAAASPSETA